VEVAQGELRELRVNQLKFMSFNREVSMKQVDKLSDSICKYGILRVPVIVKTRAMSGSLEYYIVDGQHLIKSLIKNEVSKVTCLIFESENKAEIVNTMAVLNNIVKKWTPENYVKAFAGLGDSNYQQLQTRVEISGFSYTAMGTILGNATKIKQGTFVVENTDANSLIRYVSEICSILEAHNNKFITGFVSFYRHPSLTRYNHSEFKLKLLTSLEEFKHLPYISREATITEKLLEVYNR
jgi:hypothetical protein